MKKLIEHMDIKSFTYEILKRVQDDVGFGCWFKVGNGVSGVSPDALAFCSRVSLSLVRFFLFSSQKRERNERNILH